MTRPKSAIPHVSLALRAWRYMNVHATNGIWTGTQADIADGVGCKIASIGHITETLTENGDVTRLVRGGSYGPSRFQLVSEPMNRHVGRANPWSDQQIIDLDRMWREGHTTPVIARALGVTKNAVCGMARRRGLSERGSPINRSADYVPRPAPVPRPTQTLPALASGVRPPSPFDNLAFRAPKVKEAPPVYRRLTECCWPIGDVGAAGFRFCGDASAPGKSYCGTHCGVAYVRAGRRDEVVGAITP